MRKVKKLLGLLLAAVMVLAMGVPTFAASGSYTLTISGASAGILMRRIRYSPEI